MEFIKYRNLSKEEYQTGKTWREVTSSYDKGHVFDQTSNPLMSPDMNWCAGATVANVYQGLTGVIESGSAIYETARALKPETQYLTIGGLSIPAAFNALAKRQNLKNASIIILNNFEEIMRCLVAKSPIAFGGSWPTGMFYPQGYCRGKWIEYSGGKIGGHAATILGTSSRGYVRIENSWGFNWGNKGTAYMKWEEFEKFSKSEKFSAFGLDLGE